MVPWLFNPCVEVVWDLSQYLQGVSTIQTVVGNGISEPSVSPDNATNFDPGGIGFRNPASTLAVGG